MTYHKHYFCRFGELATGSWLPVANSIFTSIYKSKFAVLVNWQLGYQFDIYKSKLKKTYHKHYFCRFGELATGSWLPVANSIFTLYIQKQIKKKLSLLLFLPFWWIGNWQLAASCQFDIYLYIQKQIQKNLSLLLFLPFWWIGNWQLAASCQFDIYLYIQKQIQKKNYHKHYFCRLVELATGSWLPVANSIFNYIYKSKLKKNYH